MPKDASAPAVGSFEQSPIGRGGRAKSDLSVQSLRAFLELSRNLSFTQAAKRLGVSQPFISTQIQRLEDQLGLLLLVRSTRRVQLSAAGRYFLKYAAEVVDASDRATAAAADFQNGLKEYLHIGGSPFRAASRWMLLNAFGADHPSISVNILTDTSPGLIEKLRSGELRLAYLYGAVPKDLPRLLISRLPVGVILPQDSPLASLESIDPGLLRNRRVYLFPREVDHAVYGATVDLLRSNGIATSAMPEHTGEAATELVQQGGALVSVQFWSDGGGGALVFRPLRGLDRILDYSLVRADGPLDGAAGMLWDYVENYVRAGADAG